MSSAAPPPPLTRLGRLPERGRHDRATIDAILDAGLVAHVGFLRQGRPSVIPTLYLRHGDEVVIHGSPASALLRTAKAGADLCLTVTVLDGLVLARSAFHHSANYRSVVVYGSGRWIERPERDDLLDLFVDRVVPDRLPHLRPPTRNELVGTAMVGISLTDASAKVRSGPPVDDDSDVSLGIWAGVVPTAIVAGSPRPDDASVDLPIPEHVAALRLPQEGRPSW